MESELQPVLKVRFEGTYPSDGMSSDATVVCIDSDAEDEQQQQQEQGRNFAAGPGYEDNNGRINSRDSHIPFYYTNSVPSFGSFTFQHLNQLQQHTIIHSQQHPHPPIHHVAPQILHHHHHHPPHHHHHHHHHQEYLKNEIYVYEKEEYQDHNYDHEYDYDYDYGGRLIEYYGRCNGERREVMEREGRLSWAYEQELADMETLSAFGPHEAANASPSMVWNGNRHTAYEIQQQQQQQQQIPEYMMSPHSHSHPQPHSQLQSQIQPNTAMEYMCNTTNTDNSYHNINYKNQKKKNKNSGVISSGNKRQSKNGNDVNFYREKNNLNDEYGCNFISSKKNDGGKQPSKNTNIPTDSSTNANTNTLPKQKNRGSRRRGKRGGKSKKNFDNNQRQNHQPLIQNNIKIDMDEIPKLEKNFEDELAKEMADQASDEGALAQSFSSLRLHVPGGSTMIILNDKEMTNEKNSEDVITDEIQESSVTYTVTPSRMTIKNEKENNIETDILTNENNINENKIIIEEKEANETNGVNDEIEKSVSYVMNNKTSNIGVGEEKPKGIGAFFPPHLLEQVKSEKCHGRTNSNVSTASSSQKMKLNIKASPFVPPSPQSPYAIEQSTVAQQSLTAPESESKKTSSENINHNSSHSKSCNGTGCFIPLYKEDSHNKSQEILNELRIKASTVESMCQMGNNKNSSIDDEIQSGEMENLIVYENEMVEQRDDNDEEDDDMQGTELLSDRSLSPLLPPYSEQEDVSGSSLMVIGDLRPYSTKNQQQLPYLDIVMDDEKGDLDEKKETEYEMIKNEKFITFTSPLHLEETLDGLQAEREAREQYEERLIFMEMENSKLKHNMEKLNNLESEVNHLKDVNVALQALLCCTIAITSKKANMTARGTESPEGELEVYQKSSAAKEKSKIKNCDDSQSLKKEMEKNKHSTAVAAAAAAPTSVLLGSSLDSLKLGNHKQDYDNNRISIIETSRKTIETNIAVINHQKISENEKSSSISNSARKQNSSHNSNIKSKKTTATTANTITVAKKSSIVSAESRKIPSPNELKKSTTTSNVSNDKTQEQKSGISKRKVTQSMSRTKSMDRMTKANKDDVNGAVRLKRNNIKSASHWH